MSEQTQKQSIGERMQARQGEATEKIKSLLWADGDADEIAQVALAGGLDGAKVDTMAAAIGAAKEKLQAATTANDQLPTLTKAHAEATEQARTAAAKLAEADAADDAARAALGCAEETLRVANVARDAGARLLADGIIPPDVAPAFMVEIVERWNKQEAASKRASRIQTLQRQEIPWRENRVKALAQELKEQKAVDPKRENQTIGASGFVDMQTALAARLKTERAELKSARDELKTLEETAA
jgi:hypothetical protein